MDCRGGCSTGHGRPVRSDDLIRRRAQPAGDGRTDTDAIGGST